MKRKIFWKILLKPKRNKYTSIEVEENYDQFINLPDNDNTNNSPILE